MEKSKLHTSNPSQRAHMKYVKSPLNYTGGKYKLLPRILPLLPYRIETFADLFMGGGNVAVNVPAKKHFCNDLNGPIIELFKAFRAIRLEELLERIDFLIAKYQLTKQNEAGFLQLRVHYNETRDPIALYTLTCYSFNYQFRFNSQLEYNNPFGRDRSYFSERMRKNLEIFVRRLQELDMEFDSRSFLDIPLDNFTPADFLYCDPPSLLTTAHVGGNRGIREWKKGDEEELYDYLDRADARGLRFALSGLLAYRGGENDMLYRWGKRYRMIDLSFAELASGAQPDRDAIREVLVVNYGVDNGNFIAPSFFG